MTEASTDFMAIVTAMLKSVNAGIEKCLALTEELFDKDDRKWLEIYEINAASLIQIIQYINSQKNIEGQDIVHNAVPKQTKPDEPTAADAKDFLEHCSDICSDLISAISSKGLVDNINILHLRNGLSALSTYIFTLARFHPDALRERTPPAAAPKWYLCQTSESLQLALEQRRSEPVKAPTSPTWDWSPLVHPKEPTSQPSPDITPRESMLYCEEELGGAAFVTPKSSPLLPYSMLRFGSPAEPTPVSKVSPIPPSQELRAMVHTRSLRLECSNARARSLRYPSESARYTPY
jgi:hypothetical protein